MDEPSRRASTVRHRQKETHVSNISVSGESQFDQPTLRAISWNLERKRPDSLRGAEAIDHLFGQNADVMALSEVRTSIPTRGGHAEFCEPPRGSTFAENERKIMIWSREPWVDIDRFGGDGLDQTRFISGTTATPVGDVRMIGVCIPWHMAEVTFPIDVKRKPWELHIRFLELLGELIADCPIPTIVAGDFNQRVPRIKGSHKAAAAAMSEAFDPFDVVTQGQLRGCIRPGIDHIAVSSHLRATDAWGWAHNVNGNRLTDHDGAAADLANAV
jgi:hypothetical protein